MNQTRTIPYEPRSLVQNALGPFDRLPGLQVGQRWESRVVNPLTGRIETGPRRGDRQDGDPLGQRAR